MQIYFSLAVCLIGGIGFLVIPPAYPDAKALLKDMFWTGLLVFLFQVGGVQLAPLGK